MLVWAKEPVRGGRVVWPAILKAHKKRPKDGNVWVYNLGSKDFSQVKTTDIVRYSGHVLMVVHINDCCHSCCRY